MSLLQTTQFSSSVQISLTRFHNNFCYPIEIGGNLWLSRCHHWVVCVNIVYSMVQNMRSVGTVCNCKCKPD